MKNNAMALVYLLMPVMIPLLGAAQSEPFIFTELNLKPGGMNNYRLGHPFEIIYGPDDHLYITEKVGRVLRVDTGTGMRQVILDHRANVYLGISRNGGGWATSISQNGMMGMALHPGFNQGTGQDSIFIAYTYIAGSVRISRFKYNGGATPSLTDETILISGIPASNDHSTGRLIIGADNNLYYACGDMGNNQFNNRCSPIRSQDEPSSGDLSVNNYASYSGKILRIALDGSVPSDNPVFGGVRSHVYTKGHRNPQGLVWEKTPSDGYSFPTPVNNGKLFSAEHGPRTDDEINIIEPGKNYGWPYIAGDSDNVNYEYINWSSAGSPNCNISYTENAVPVGAVVMQESDAPADVKLNFRKPVFNMYTTCGTQTVSTCNANGTDWMKFATVAPASIDFYNINSGLGIPGWYPSLLVPTLRKGTLYRLKLNTSRDGVTSDTIPYFATYNRYRDIAMSPDGLKIFIVTDSIGATSGPSGTGTSILSNPGSILVYQYNGSTLPLKNDRIRNNIKYNVNIYPNPASDVVNVELEKSVPRLVHYLLYDITGRLIVGGISSKNTFTIPVSGLRRGMYVVKIADGYGKEIIIEKIILR